MEISGFTCMPGMRRGPGRQGPPGTALSSNSSAGGYETLHKAGQPEFIDWITNQRLEARLKKVTTAALSEKRQRRRRNLSSRIGDRTHARKRPYHLAGDGGLIMTPTLIQAMTSPLNQTTESTMAQVSLPKLIDDHTSYVLHVVFYVTLNSLVSIAGMAANVINVIVFIKQGIFTDSCTMALLGLAVSDFFCLITLLWLGICFIIVFEQPPGLNWDPAAILFNTAGRPHTLFSQVTCWITALISFERCISVLFPFKARRLFSAKKTMIVIVFIFAFTFLINTPLYMLEQLQWRRIPGTNQTKLIIVSTGLISMKLITIFNYLNPVALRFLSISSVMIFNVVITWRVKLSTKWRSEVTSSGETVESNKEKQSKTKDETAFQKEKSLVKMITMISVVFSICYTPEIILAVVTTLDQRVNHLDQYNNLFHVLHSVTFFFESINSSVNIIIYYRMSTRYREEFRKLMRLK